MNGCQRTTDAANFLAPPIALSANCFRCLQPRLTIYTPFSLRFALLGAFVRLARLELANHMNHTFDETLILSRVRLKQRLSI